MTKHEHGSPKPATSSLVEVPFHGEILHAVRDGKDVWVSVRRVCEIMKISHQVQARKLKSKAWARVTIMVTRDSAGRNQDASFLHLDCLPIWLATIETTRVATEVRPTLIAFQKECAQVLRDHFFGRKVPANDSHLEERVTMLERGMVIVHQTLEAVHQSIQVLTARLAPASPVESVAGVVGRRSGDRIRHAIMNIARMYVDTGVYKSLRAARMSVDLRVRSGAGYSGKGRKWDLLPLEKEGLVTNLLEDIRQEATRIYNVIQERRQPFLFDERSLGLRKAN